MNHPHDLIEIKTSSIHHFGIFAKKDIAKGTKIIEYIGEKISKKQSARRSQKTLKTSQKDPSAGAVYMFELDDEWDIDGNVENNPARFLNHSCDPNCEVEIEDGHIWIYAKRDIKKGEELLYNYGYDLEFYQDHPCKCNSKRCVGYIVHEDHWEKLKELLQKN
ncbi:SET domain-containing protein-lysine N-methyltransferase [Candidatus Woesearchaeota archaeon]|nr:SET domain-containing protein-lysine N-methyltransferase [Candidatus Woesearchaeota archaeon]